MSVLDPGAPLVIWDVPAGARAAYTIAETADLLGCTKYLVHQAIRDGKLHVVELGPQARRIPAWSIDQLLGRPHDRVELTVVEDSVA